MTIGENMKRIRRIKGITQKQLGEKMGVTQQRIAQFELDKILPKYETVEKIAEALGVNPADIDESLVIDLSGDWDIAPGQLSEEMKEFIRSGTLADHMASNYIKLNENGKILANALVESLTDIDDTLKGMKLKEK